LGTACILIENTATAAQFWSGHLRGRDEYGVGKELDLIFVKYLGAGVE
jgi:hypothetical protein